VSPRFGREVPSPETVHSIPLDGALHGPPPARFRDGEILTIQYVTDSEAVADLVPAPLEPASSVVMVQIARWGDVPGLGRNAYECNVMLAVRLTSNGRTVEGSYSPYFYVDSDRAMAGGREFHGQPKRLADVQLATLGDLIVGTVTRNGITVFTGTLPYKAQRATLDDVRRRVDLVTNINLKIIPHIDGRTAVRQLTARDLTDVDVVECWTGPGTAEIRPSAQAPMYRLPVLEHLEGYYWRADFSLVGGVVLHDYLQDANKE
jgi:acetoacetate decarboxylase